MYGVSNALFGMLDERIVAAEWDFYFTLRKLENEVGDVIRCMTVGGSYVRHFIRATVKANPEPYACRHKRLPLMTSGQEKNRYAYGANRKSFLLLARQLRLCVAYGVA